MLRRHDCLVLERSLYDVCLCVDETGLMMSEGANLGGDGCVWTETLRTYTVSENTLGYGTGWCETNVDCGVNSDGDVG